MRGTDVSDMKRTYRTQVSEEISEGDIGFNFEKIGTLRYGENPNQPAGVYQKGELQVNFTSVKDGKGGLSATNRKDLAHGIGILKYFEHPSVAVMKHLVPSGFATQYENRSLDEIYQLARDADARSAFGSGVVLNRPIDKATAEALDASYVEVIAAPDYEEGTVDLLSRKKNLRLQTYSGHEKLQKFVGDTGFSSYDIRWLETGHIIIQKPYLSSIKGKADLVLDAKIHRKGADHIVAKDPSEQELEDMLTGWYVNFGVRSNGIVIVKEGVTLAIGSGQQERVGAVEQAIVKAYQKAMDRQGIEYDALRGITGCEKLTTNPLNGAVLSSDGFFPFRDSIDIMARVGISGVIQPGGSVRDYEVIDAANEHNMAMALTLERCFGHF